MRSAITVLFGLLLLAGCQGATPFFRTGLMLSPEAQALAGDRAAPAVEARYGGILRDADAEARLLAIAARLAEPTPALRMPYQIRLLQSTRLNACSLPGGRIYLTLGLYRQLGDDAQIAAVLAHEMAHIVGKDHFKSPCGTPHDALVREKNADAAALRFLHRAGIEPSSLVTVLHAIRHVQPPGWSDSRIAEVRRGLSDLSSDTRLARRGP